MSMFRRRIIMQSDNKMTPSNAPNGVYIYSTDGFIYKKEEWDSSNTNDVIGVVYISDNCKFCIPINYSKVTVFQGMTITSTNLTQIDLEDSAKLDFNGYDNTNLILSTNYTSVDYLGIDECANYVFKNGENGYLMSAGEYCELYSNKEKIEELIKYLGINSSLLDDFVITSTISTHASNGYTTFWIGNYGNIYPVVYSVDRFGGNVLPLLKI